MILACVHLVKSMWEGKHFYLITYFESHVLQVFGQNDG